MDVLSLYTCKGSNSYKDTVSLLGSPLREETAPVAGPQGSGVDTGHFCEVVMVLCKKIVEIVCALRRHGKLFYDKTNL